MPLFTVPIHEHGDPSRPGPYPHGSGAAAELRSTENFLRLEVSRVVNTAIEKGALPSQDFDTVEDWHESLLVAVAVKETARDILDHPGLGALATELKFTGSAIEQAAQIAEYFIRDWQATASVGITANVVQLAAAEEFGIPVHETPNVEDRTAAQAFYTRHHGVLQAMVRGQYDRTQSMLARDGVTEVVVLRGITESLTSGSADYRLSPLSSFTVEPHVLDRWQNGTVLVATLPASRVFSFARTGFGTLGEREFVILGGDVAVRAYAMKAFVWPPKE